MSRSIHGILPQEQYAAFRAETAEWVAKAFKKSLSTGELTKLETYKRKPTLPSPGADAEPFRSECDERYRFARKLIKDMILAKQAGDLRMEKVGVTSGLGYNFYDLRAPVLLLYPVNTPFRNMLPRQGRVNDGYGTAANWKANRSIGVVYGGVAEGQRNAAGTPDINEYTASYKELGSERSVTFTAQYAGEGYANNLADEHLRGLQTLWLQEEGMLLNGNAGITTGNNGFAFNGSGGSTATPTPAAAANDTAATLSASTKVSAAVVLLTAMGNPANAQYGYGVFPTVAGGLTPSYRRDNADGSTTTINGGMSKISPMSAVITTDSTNPSVKFTVPTASRPVKGCFGYAWFVNVTDSSNPSLSNAYLHSITTVPELIVSSAPTGTQTGAATGLDGDHSFNTLDFDGLLTYTASTSGAIWTDIYGGSLTSEKNGRVTQIETILAAIFNAHQAGIDEIWGSADAIANVDAAIRYNGTQQSGYQFIVQRDGQNNLLGGFVVSGYQSRYAINSPTGANVIPLKIHPMIPPGTLYFMMRTNPYPHSRMGNVIDILVQRDYYAIEWPLLTRQWTHGTYVHEVVQHNMPWISAVLTGIGAFVGS